MDVILFLPKWLKGIYGRVLGSLVAVQAHYSEK